MQNILPDNQHCTGCAACYNSCAHHAISMERDSEGFLNPKIDSTKCTDCGLCVKKCPVLSVPQQPENLRKVFAAYILDKSIRRRSSSGGLFPAFANYIYSKKGFVCASSFDEKLNLRFKMTDGLSELQKFQGSKYVQSEVGEIYKEIKQLLRQEKPVLFIGTPCQVAGLKSYLSKPYANLITIDLICHGVPSPGLFENYLKVIGLKMTSIPFNNYLFRHPKDSVYFLSSYETIKGKLKYIPVNKHSYICAYLKGWIHRECCYSCPFTGDIRQGDCTIGDFWGILAGKFSFGGEKNMGVSMVMANTIKGSDLLSAVSDKLYLEEKSYEEAKIDNHNLYKPDTRPSQRDYSYHELSSLSSEEFMKKYNCQLYLPTSLYRKIISKLSNFIRLK